jgi:hypothetical protein
MRSGGAVYWVQRDDMPTVDFTKDELLKEVRVIVREEMVEERGYTRQLVSRAVDDAKTELRAEIKRLGKSIDENYLAEAKLVTRLERKLGRHVGDKSAHR